MANNLQPVVLRHTSNGMSRYLSSAAGIRRAAGRGAVGVLFALLVSLHLGLASSDAMAQEDDGEAATEPSLRYTVELEGVPKGELAKTIQAIAELYTRKDDPPASLIGLRQRADDDENLIHDYLRSEGYFASRVTVRIAEGRPAQATIEVELGDPYPLSEVRFEPEKEPLPPELTPAAVGLETGARFRAKEIVSAQARTATWLRSRARPFAQVSRRRVVVDHASRTVIVTYWISAGPPAHFGGVEISGLERTRPSVVYDRLAWSEGEPYSVERLNETRDRLIETQVFRSVRLEPVPPAGPDGAVTVRVSVEERKPRTVGLGADFSTSQGPGGHVSWTHRNLFGAAEKLTFRGRGSFEEQQFLARFRRPLLFGGPQDLIVTGRFDERDLDAYNSREILGLVEVERRMSKKLTVSAGVSFEISSVTDAGETDDFRLFGLPLSARYDATDSLLNPKSGYRLDARVTPLTGTGLFFVQATARARAYWTPGSQDRFTLAAWTRVGTVSGEPLSDIPGNHRLYSGGGGSVRGFGFQRAGPLDDANNPLGGRSLFEVGLEGRIRIKGNWGAAVFVEAGSVFERTYPDFGRPLRVGVGVGVRYYTSIGPIRLDLAFPVNRRDGDDAFQIYISIGQAF